MRCARIESAFALPCFFSRRASSGFPPGHFARNKTAEGEGPLQIGIAHLPPALADDLPRRAVLALHQPAVGRELLDAREALDIVDLVQDREGQDLPDARDGPEQLEAVRIVATRSTHDRQLQLADDRLVVLDELEGGSDALLHARVLEALSQALT